MRPVFARHYDQFIARMEKAWLDAARAELLHGLTGTVVELGAGTGRNLAHYPSTVGRLVLTEPSPTMRDQIRTRLREVAPAFEVEIVDATADRLPCNDGSADAVVSTLVLCSVPALGPAVAEIRRVLRPGGELRLIEHVAAERTWARRVQRTLDPAWNWIEGSCHLDHETSTALAAGGFDVAGVDEAIEPGMPPLFHRIARGRAIAPA
jgi:ubiquinone/menaquinone biosynthesis C-methylase UbiE